MTLSLGQLGSFGPVQLALKLLTETPSFWHCDQLPPPPRKKTRVVPFSRISAVGFPSTWRAPFAHGTPCISCVPEPATTHGICCVHGP